MPAAIIKSDAAKSQIIALFDTAPRRTYRRSDLLKILTEHRDEWGGGAAYWGQAEFINFLLENTDLEKINLYSERYGDEARYIWRYASTFDIALSLRRHSYLTHGTAISLHRLTRETPTTVYLNHEQSAKPRGGTLSQEAIVRAFGSPQRRSNYVLSYNGVDIMIINGKNTGRLGVIELTGADGETLELTSIERTLIDSSVRPGYAGGISSVVEAFRGARETVSTAGLLTMLQRLDYNGGAYFTLPASELNLRK